MDVLPRAAPGAASRFRGEVRSRGSTVSLMCVDSVLLTRGGDGSLDLQPHRCRVTLGSCYHLSQARPDTTVPGPGPSSDPAHPGPSLGTYSFVAWVADHVTKWKKYNEMIISTGTDRALDKCCFRLRYNPWQTRRRKRLSPLTEP